MLSKCQLSQSCQQGLDGALGALWAPPVDVTQLVQRVDGQHHLSQVELGQLGREAVLKAAQQSEEVPTGVVVHHQVLDGGGWGKNQMEKEDTYPRAPPPSGSMGSGRQGCVSHQLWGGQLPTSAQAEAPRLVGRVNLLVLVGGVSVSLSLDPVPLAPKGLLLCPRQSPSKRAQDPHQVLLILEGIMQRSHPAAVPLHQHIPFLPETGCL